jgi:hypothetical protein
MTVLRLLIVLSGIVLTINGCNGLLSQFFGTHKLQTYHAETALREGVGDADFVSLTDGFTTGRFVVGPALHETDKDILLYPIFSAAQADSLEQGQSVTAGIIGWETNYDPPCIERADCVAAGSRTLTGLVREPNPRKNRVADLGSEQVRIAGRPLFMEIDREPLAWYWNLLMFAGGIGMAFAVEAYFARRRQALRDRAGAAAGGSQSNSY